MICAGLFSTASLSPKHHHRRAGGSIIKDAFDVLEKNNYIKKTKKGRVIAPAGKSLLDKMSNEILKEGA